MVKINIDKLMKDKKISRYKLQQMTNWNYKRINALYFSKVKYLTLEEIEILCDLFKCSCNDLIIIKSQ